MRRGYLDHLYQVFTGRVARVKPHVTPEITIRDLHGDIVVTLLDWLSNGMGLIELRMLGRVVKNLNGRSNRTHYLDVHRPLAVTRHLEARQKHLRIIVCRMDLQTLWRFRDLRIAHIGNTFKTVCRR